MAELRFRRIFQAEMDARGWNMPGVVMKMAESAVPYSPLGRSTCPYWSVNARVCAILARAPSLRL